MMAKGGIVGEFTDKTGRSAPISEDGSIGFVGPGLALIPSAAAVMSRIGTGLASQKLGGLANLTGTGMIPKFVQKGKELIPYVGPKTGTSIVPSVSEGVKQGFGAKTLDFLKNHYGKTLFGLGGASLFFMGDDNEIEPIPETVATELSAGYAPIENLGRDAYAEQYLTDLGTSETRDALTKRALEMQERVDKERADAGNMSTILTGLAIAGGKSPDAISNIAAGATAGVQDYTKRLKDADKAELQTMKLQSALDEATRAEKRAAMLYGTQSEQFIDAQNTRLQIAEMTMNFNIQKQRAAIIDSIKKNDIGYSNLETALSKQVNDGEITLATKNKQLNNYIESVIPQYTGAGSATSTAPVEITTKEELDALPSGTTYKGPDGQLYKKN
jgi:hypothetical protein